MYLVLSCRGNCLNHLCSETHINSVYAFFRKNGTNNKSIDQKWFYIGEPFRDDVCKNNDKQKR